MNTSLIRQRILLDITCILLNESYQPMIFILQTAVLISIDHSKLGNLCYPLVIYDSIASKPQIITWSLQF